MVGLTEKVDASADELKNIYDDFGICVLVSGSSTAAIKKGLTGLAITDHNNVKGSLDSNKKYTKKYKNFKTNLQLDGMNSILSSVEETRSG
jgi:F420-0:gamma-glutamyl ligase